VPRRDAPKTIDDAQRELERLHREIEQSRNESDRLRDENARLERERDRLRREIERLTQALDLRLRAGLASVRRHPSRRAHLPRSPVSPAVARVDGMGAMPIDNRLPRSTSGSTSLCPRRARTAAAT
jgi:uncharacterized protein YhaN